MLIPACRTSSSRSLQGSLRKQHVPFDFPLDSCQGPHPDHNVVTFLSSLSETSRKLIRSMRIYASSRRLEEESHGAGWPSMCRYLASKVQLQRLALVIVNDCSTPETDVEKMQEICRMDKAWVKYHTWISRLRCFTFHTARCPFRDAPFEGRDNCPATLPLTAEIIHTFNDTQRWTEADRKNGSVLRYDDGYRAYELPKNPMARHLLRHHFNPFYNWPVGPCISHRLKEAVRIELGV